jgi:hypothetical protein
LARSPHFALPFSAAGSTFASTEQGTPAEVDDCVTAVMRTPEGSRIDAPDYGRPDDTFKQLGTGSSASPYLAAIEAAEPRAAVTGEAQIEDLVERIVIKESA